MIETRVYGITSRVYGSHCNAITKNVNLILLGDYNINYLDKMERSMLKQ